MKTDDGPAMPPAPWRPAAAGLTTLGVPAVSWMLHPVLGEVVASVELAVALTILGTALYGSRVLSERAFRLLRWVRNKPEPPTPE